MEEKPKRWGLLLVIVGVALVVGGGVYLLFGGKASFISPIPAEPSFKVIYFTPTPGPVTPSSTPSATPKVKATPTKSVPTKADVTPSVTPKTSPSVTPKAIVTITPTP